MDKLKTGVKGLDAILEGGYPRGRPTLLKAGPGCGKTIFCQLFASQCVTAKHHVCFVSCDESPSMIIENMDKLGLQGSLAQEKGKLSLLDFRPSLDDIVVGDFEFKAILLRIQNNLKGKRPVLIVDSLHNLFMGLQSNKTELALLELCNWSRENGVTLLFTSAESSSPGDGHVFEEYATDCVIQIKQIVHTKLMTRFLRVVKYRGSSHGTNQYPFLIHNKGISIFPITATLFNPSPSRRRASTGIKALDDMLGGGYFNASSILISGTSGTAKSIISAQIAHAAMFQRHKVIYFTYEESLTDFMFNTKSVGIDLQSVVKKEQMILKSVRAVEKGLEEHLIEIFEAVEAVKPSLVIIDPITSLLDLGTSLEVKSFLVRFISYLKQSHVTTLFVELLKENTSVQSEVGILSLIDTAIKLEQKESNGELNRLIQVRKARGSKVSNQIKEFIITDKGCVIQSPYVGNGEIVLGSAKQQQMLIDKQHQLSTEKQLEVINAQLKRIEKNKPSALTSEEIQTEGLKYSLLDKKRLLEVKLKNMQAIQQMNEKLRE